MGELLPVLAKGGGKRKGGRKVRTGCKTCRIRRVKCDEAKPECLRCVSFWGKCEGYHTLEEGKHVLPTKLHALLPKSAPLRKERKLEITKARGIIRQPDVGPEFETSEDRRLYDVFLQCTSVSLSGAFDSPLWVRILPQHSTALPFLRYGIAALGALTVANSKMQSSYVEGGKKSTTMSVPCTEAWEKACDLYAKALRHLRIALSSRHHTTREVLLGCLLVVCFEGFVGNYCTAMKHAQHGITIFFSWMDKEVGYRHYTKPIDDFSSPNPHDLEDDLVDAMRRLDVQVVSYFDPRPAGLHKYASTMGRNVIKFMPDTFTSLREARHHWEVIELRVYHFLAYVLLPGSRKSLKILGPTTDTVEDTHAPIGVKLFAQNAFPLMRHTAERDKFLAEITLWERSLTRFTIKTSIPCRASTMLSIHAKMNRLLLTGAFFKSEMEHDALWPEFRSIFELCKSIWSLHITGEMGYHFDFGLLPPLFLVCTRCRDPSLRRQVVSLLSSACHRENAWDSLSVAFIGRWVLGKEEEGTSFEGKELETEWSSSTNCVMESSPAVIPEEKRIRITQFNTNFRLRCVQLEYTQGVSAQDGSETCFEETVLKW